MKAIMLMFDSLNRLMLEPYGCEWTKTPNFQRLAEKTVRFSNSYAGSLPCIPARRELHTGRFNFMHRSWGPLEPWDDSMPELLKNKGICSHLISDHTHYWEDGGATYHTRYHSWEYIRGQEGDPWKVLPELIQNDKCVQNKDGEYFPVTRKMHNQDMTNRKYCADEERMPLAQTFACGLEFLENNYMEENWFLQLECFDPHEPFCSTENYKALYPHDYDGPLYDWPPYHHVTEDRKTANHLKMEYAALLSMCDTYLGKLLDFMDDRDMWKDTMLIVNTDHGYLLGEHGWWSKGCMPWYDELVHTPLFVHDPRFPHPHEVRDQIVQTIDMPATILEFFGIALPKDMQGKPLCEVIENRRAIHRYALFGVHGGHINIFDGRYVYMKAPDTKENQPLYEYTLMPTHMRNRFNTNELMSVALEENLKFTKGCPVLKIAKATKKGDGGFSALLVKKEKRKEACYIDNNSLTNATNFGDKLFDLQLDPKQETVMSNLEIELKMANLLVEAMKENEAPEEQFLRMGLPADRVVTTDDIIRIHNNDVNSAAPEILKEYQWSRFAHNAYCALMKFITPEQMEQAIEKVKEGLAGKAEDHRITDELILTMIPLIIPQEHCDMVNYFVSLAGRNS